jgi:hypothetical protein
MGAGAGRLETNMSRWVPSLAAAALVLAAAGPSFSQPSAPPSDDPLRWDANQTAQFNTTFAKTTHDSCLNSAEKHGVTADAAERYCSCVVHRLESLSVEDKMALPQHHDTMVAASNACRAQ